MGECCVVGVYNVVCGCGVGCVWCGGGIMGVGNMGVGNMGGVILWCGLWYQC